MNLTFNKVKVLECLESNRIKHTNIVREAQKGFRKKWEYLLVKALDDVRKGKKIKSYLSLDIPVSHIEDFDRAISMLNTSIDDTVELSSEQFQYYIENNWKWREQFLLSNSAYSDIAAANVSVKNYDI